MKKKAGLIWDSELLFNRFIEDCDVSCELVTPHMLAAPFYRGRFVTFLVPTGFGNRMFSNLLPALRASSERIEAFVENGGNLLVFGAMDVSPASYDWLPFPLTYVHEYFTTTVKVDPGHEQGGFIENPGDHTIDCDGYFTEYEGEPVATSEDGRVVMVCNEVGKGTIIATSFHEYPSRNFIRSFCTRERETLF
jgi:hypothetical protein